MDAAAFLELAADEAASLNRAASAIHNRAVLAPARFGRKLTPRGGET